MEKVTISQLKDGLSAYPPSLDVVTFDGRLKEFAVKGGFNVL